MTSPRLAIRNAALAGLSDDAALADFGEGLFGLGLGLVVLVWGHEFGAAARGGSERRGRGREPLFLASALAPKGVLSLGNVPHETEVLGERGERARGDGARGGDRGNADAREHGVAAT